MEARQDPAVRADQAADLVRGIVGNLARVVHAPDETLRLCALCLLSEARQA